MKKPIIDPELLEWAESPSAETATPVEGKQASGYGTGPGGEGEAPFYQHINRILQNLFRRAKELLFYASRRDEILGSQTQVTDKDQRPTLYLDGVDFKNSLNQIQALSGKKKLLVQEMALSTALDLSSLEVDWEMESLDALIELEGQNLTLGAASGEIRLANQSATPSQVILKGRCNGLRILTTTGNITVSDSDPGFAGSYFLNGVLTSARTQDLENRLSTAETQLSGVENQLATVESQITGMVAAFLVETAPIGWLECNGQTISRSTYANLFAALGTRYGAGDGVTSFRLPDLRGQFLRGWDHGTATDPDRDTRTDRGDGTAGNNIGTRQGHAFQGHGHNIRAWTTNTLANVILDGYYSSWGDNTAAGSGRTGGYIAEAKEHGYGTPQYATETRPNNTNVMYCVKY